MNLRAIKEEFTSFSLVEKLFILSAMLCGFCITAEYAIVRPVSNSVFIQAYGSEGFPYAWLVAIPLTLLVVFLYNRFLPKLGCWKMFCAVLLIVAGGNLCCAFFLKKFFALPFIFYVWKEAYIMLFFQLLWSVIHSTIKTGRAKYLYGILFAVGGAGGAIGSMIPSLLAVKMGSEGLLFLSFPIYGILAGCYFMLLKYSNIQTFQEQVKEKQPPLRHSMQMIMNSRLLSFILLIVVFMQLSATIVDYQFNTVLEREFPIKDLRTAYAGKIFGMMNMMTVTLQCFGSFLLVHFLGVRRSHFLVPMLLCVNAIGFVFFPVFNMISFAFMTIKSVDFSIFGVIKEMLYIPMKVDEKFRAKAFIDVFAHRASKAFASFLILGCQFFKNVNLLSLLAWGSIAIFLMWFLVVSALFKKEESPVDSVVT